MLKSRRKAFDIQIIIISTETSKNSFFLTKKTSDVDGNIKLFTYRQHMCFNVKNGQTQIYITVIEFPN